MVEFNYNTPSYKLTRIDFHGSKLVAIEGDTPETTLVAMKPVVEGMGLNWEGQRKKINSHPVISKGTTVTVIPSSRGDQHFIMLSLDLLNFWLATIHPDRIKDKQVRDKVIEYQTECARVLFNYFFGKAIKHQPILPNQLGGIAKGVINKALAPLFAEMDELRKEIQIVKDSYDPSSAFVTNYKPMIAIVKDLNVPSKGRRGLVCSCSAKCNRFLIKSGKSHMVRISRETGRYVYHIDGVSEWLNREGKGMIAAHIDKINGQNRFHLVTPTNGDK